MTTDLLATSAATWRDRDEDPPVIPDELRPPRDGGLRDRNRALWRRHDLRRQRAEDVYAASRNPVRGWPVSGNRAVLDFFGDLVRRQKRAFAVLVLLNALAAGTALVVPRLLGALVNRVESQGAAVDGLDELALTVVGVVVLQALFTFGAQRTSTHFGQDLLASAREYVVGTILRLPVGRVEGASTGDLVTRVKDSGFLYRAGRLTLLRAGRPSGRSESLGAFPTGVDTPEGSRNSYAWSADGERILVNRPVEPGNLRRVMMLLAGS